MGGSESNMSWVGLGEVDLGFALLIFTGSTILLSMSISMSLSQYKSLHKLVCGSNLVKQNGTKARGTDADFCCGCCCSICCWLRTFAGSHECQLFGRLWQCRLTKCNYHHHYHYHYCCILAKAAPLHSASAMSLLHLSERKSSIAVLSDHSSSNERVSAWAAFLCFV